MGTTTKTYTLTDAKYLGSKVAADLKQMQNFYGWPSDAEINNYVDEFVLLVKDGYLGSIDYGFKEKGRWVVAVSYEVSTFNSIDDRPGRVPVGVDITNASRHTYLRKSAKFELLSPADQQKVIDSLPIDRGDGPDPQIGANATYDKTYGSGDVEIKRKTFK